MVTSRVRKTPCNGKVSSPPSARSPDQDILILWEMEPGARFRAETMKLHGMSIVRSPDPLPRAMTGEASAPETVPSLRDYDVVVIGGGPAGLAAASFCGRKGLRTAVFEGDSWGGILTRWCPDKRIDDYPGVRPGIRARELASFLIDEAHRAEVDLISERVGQVTRDREVRSANGVIRGKQVVVATGSTTSEAGILREREFAGRDAGIFYLVRDPDAFRGKRVVIVGGGDTALSHARRLSGVAAQVTWIHRRKSMRTSSALPERFGSEGDMKILFDTVVERILGTDTVDGVRIRDLTSGELSDLAADAVILAVGARPNTAIFRDLGLALDGKGQVAADRWQKTNVPGILAVGDVSSHIRMIITAVAQAATAAHQAYLEIRNPYWK